MGRSLEICLTCFFPRSQSTFPSFPLSPRLGGEKKRRSLARRREKVKKENKEAKTNLRPTERPVPLRCGARSLSACCGVRFTADPSLHSVRCTAQLVFFFCVWGGGVVACLPPNRRSRKFRRRPCAVRCGKTRKKFDGRVVEDRLRETSFCCGVASGFPCAVWLEEWITSRHVCKKNKKGATTMLRFADPLREGSRLDTVF